MVQQGCRVYVSVYPVGVGEHERLRRVLRGEALAASWLNSVEHGGAWLVEARGEMLLVTRPQLLAEQLACSIWRRLGRYAKVVVEIEAADGESRWEWQEVDFQRLQA